MAGERAGWLRIGAVLSTAGAVLCGGTAAAAWEPPQPEPVPLRLDESPALPLLEPFRHAAGRPSSYLRRYLDGRFGRWRERTWHTFSFCPGEALSPAGSRGSGEGLCEAPAAAVAAGSCCGRLLPPWAGWLAVRDPGWPLFASEQHWFQPPPVDLVATAHDPSGATQLSISAAFVPPWLQRLDGTTALGLVEIFGCGRGGSCSPDATFPAAAFEQIWLALAPKRWPIPTWQCRPREVTIRAHGREADRFLPMRCDGSIPPDALDRLSILARPVGVPRPGDRLPDEPDPAAGPGEWLPSLRLLHPRLLWVLQRLADEFPWRAVYIYSGYRPAPAPPPAGSRSSYHWQGRALDLTVEGVPTEELFQLCRDLTDLGCGYYPNKPFVHIDVRPRGFGTVIWVDAAPPGEPPRYVSSWPGVVEEGAIGWAPPP